MATVTTTYDYEGAGSGNNVTATTTTAGVALVVQASGATVRHQSAAALGGSAYGLEIVSGTTGASYVEVSSFPDDDEIVIWFPYRLPTTSFDALPSILTVYGGSAGTTAILRLQMNTTDICQLQDVSSAHTATGPDLTAYMGQWVVFQITIDVNTTTTTGAVKMRVYDGVERAAGDYIGTEVSVTNWNLGASSSTAWPVAKLRLGINNTQAASRTIRMDKLKVVTESLAFIDGLTSTMASPATLAASWSVNAYVTQTLAATWNVRAMIAAANLAASWNVRTMVAAQTLAASWNVRSFTAAATLALAWGVAGWITPATLGLSWEVRAFMAAKTLALAWNVRAGVTPATLALSWLVRAYITPATLPLTWTQRAYITQVLAAAWNVRSMMAAPSTLALDWLILAEGDNTFRLVGLSGVTGTPALSTTFRLVGLSGAVTDTITVEIVGPDFVDVFETFDLIAVTSAPVASYTWQQFDGPAAVVEMAGETWRGEAPGDDERLTLKFRVTVEPGGEQAEHIVTVHKAAYFTLQPTGEWVPGRV